MKLLKPLLLALLFLNSNIVFSAPNTLVTGSVIYFTQWTTGLVIKLDTNNNSNPARCSTTGAYMINTSPDPTANNTSDSYISINENYAFMKAILLAAKMNNEKVQLSIYGGGCVSNRPKIVAVRLL